MPDPLNANEVRLLLEKACATAGGQKAWADRHHCGATLVNDVLRGRLEPTESIAAGLGLVRRFSYFPVKKVAA